MAIKCERSDHIIQLLLEKGADTSIPNEDASTALHCAIKENSSRCIIKLLLEEGAGPSIQNEDASTVLHCAIKENSSERIIKPLLGKGADPSIENRRDGETALHSTITYRRSDHIIQLLLENGADPSVKNRCGLAALHQAMVCAIVERSERSETIIQLLEKYMDPSIKDKHGQISFHDAIRCRHENAIQLFLDNGVDISIRDSYGRTPLHVTVENFWYPNTVTIDSILKTLLRHGANPLDTDNAGKTPLEYADDSIRFCVAFIMREEISKRDGHVPEILIRHTDDIPENGAKRAKSEEIEQVEAQMLNVEIDIG
ncbi:ankyrin [Morchella conica CCBAS932]|uniref:Ankyrin n=1 Tax=Morchella conica CCBAS932 TaxID=1392247 RepID=A0A3N4L076_9PEZI|nr:ankyrin [Morchella conica CCBAS932]